MGRRIVSARDQVEMLSPWRTAERAEKFEWIRGSGGNWELSTRTPDGQRVIVDTSPSRGQYTTAGRIAARRPGYGPDKLMGVNINDTLQDFTGQILSGDKTIETRDSKSLHPYVGKRIGILSTHDTRSNPRVTYLVGFATVGEPKFYDNAADFDADYDLHRVAPGSDFHIDNARHGVKWGYPVHDVKHIDPVVVTTKGNVARDLTEHMHLAAWYHTSPHRLPVGTELTPGGGRSGHDPFYRAIGDSARKDHVWVEDNPKRLKRWHDIDADANYHYRVEPVGDPRPYRDGDPSEGYVVPSARVVEDLGPAKRKGAVGKTPEQHLRDTYEPYPPDSPNLPDSLKPHLMLPTDIAHHYREYDRPDDENTQMLKRVIGDQGIRQPLKISTDGTHAMMIEGNHRLNVARQLGLSHVPVQVFLEKPGEVMTNSESSMPVPLEPHLGDWINANRQHLKSFWS